MTTGVGRTATAADLDPLTQLWHDGWRDAHLAIVPAELVQHRTLPSFRARLTAALEDVIVIDLNGEPAGFVMLRGDELHQFYVARDARGSGLAKALIAEAERELARRGVRVAWLSCAIGNDRAARFYEKCGWTRTGRFVDQSVIEGGTFRSRRGATRRSCDACVPQEPSCCLRALRAFVVSLVANAA